MSAVATEYAQGDLRPKIYPPLFYAASVAIIRYVTTDYFSPLCASADSMILYSAAILSAVQCLPDAKSNV